MRLEQIAVFKPRKNEDELKAKVLYLTGYLLGTTQVLAEARDDDYHIVVIPTVSDDPCRDDYDAFFLCYKEGCDQLVPCGYIVANTHPSACESNFQERVMQQANYMLEQTHKAFFTLYACFWEVYDWQKEDWSGTDLVGTEPDEENQYWERRLGFSTKPETQALYKGPYSPRPMGDDSKPYVEGPGTCMTYYSGTLFPGTRLSSFADAQAAARIANVAFEEGRSSLRREYHQLMGITNPRG